MYEQLVEETPVPGGLGPRLPSGLSAAGKLSKAPRTSASLADQAKPPSVGLLIGALEPIVFPLLQAVPISAHSFKALRLKSLIQLLGRGEAAWLPQESVNLEEPGVQPGLGDLGEAFTCSHPRFRICKAVSWSDDPTPRGVWRGA